ncbi:LAFA_0B03862g1_1 [Lachancea sp. 'fantastica']|nr:LAFA_0B03862g1_1 [Lachancea sp. 'fantastica']
MWTHVCLQLLVIVVRGQQYQRLDYIDQFSRSLQESDTNAYDLERIVRTNFPFHKTFCAGEALKEFLPACLENGIETVDPKLKVRAAVSLSFCEFQESGLEVRPKHCSDLKFGDINMCVEELRSSPQWWTTYSGYYQRLPTLCYEQSLPYEKDQMLGLFLNITKVYSSFSESLDAELTRKFAGLENRTDKMMETFEEALQSQIYDMNKLYADKLRSFTDVFDQVREEAVKDLTGSLVTVRNELVNADTDLWLELRSLKECLESVNVELEDRDYARQIRTLKNESLELSKEATERGLLQLKSMNEALEKVGTESTQQISEVNSNIADSYVDVLMAFQDFRDVIRNSMIPLIQDEMHPHLDEFNQKLLSNLQEIDAAMEIQTETWSDNLHNTFEKVSTGLNQTAATVQQLEIDIKTANRELGLFITTLQMLQSIVRDTLSRAYYLVTLVPVAARPFIIMYLVKVLSAIGNITPNIYQAVAYLPPYLGESIILLGALVGGSYLGFYTMV